MINSSIGNEKTLINVVNLPAKKRKGEKLYRKNIKKAGKFIENAGYI